MLKKILPSSALALLLAAPPVAGGDVERAGFVVGGGGGYGYLWEGDFSSHGYALTFHVGVMISSRTAMMLDTSAVCDHSTNPSVTICQSLFAPAVQFWVTDRFWVKAGLGGSQDRAFSSVLDDSSKVGFGVLAAAGASVARRGSYSLDLQTRLTTSRIEGVRSNTFAVLVTFNHE